MYKLRQSQKIIIIKINKIKWVMVCVNINIELSLNCQVMRWFGSAPAIVVMWWWVSNLYLFVKYSHFVVEETGWRIGYGQLLCHFSRACTSWRNHHVLVGGILGIICQVSHYHEGSCFKRLVRLTVGTVSVSHYPIILLYLAMLKDRQKNIWRREWRIASSPFKS